MNADFLVTSADLRAAGRGCKDTRFWFERYGFDYRDFLRNGLPASALRATGDPLAIPVIEAAEKRHGR